MRRGVITLLIGNRNFKIVARFRHNAADYGVLFAIGDVAGGLALLIEDGTLRLSYNGYGRFHALVGPAMPVGERSAALQYEALGRRRGRGRLMLDTGEAGEWSELSPTLMGDFTRGSISVSTAVLRSIGHLRERQGIFRYGGTIHDLIIESGPLAHDMSFAGG